MIKRIIIRELDFNLAKHAILKFIYESDSWAQSYKDILAFTHSKLIFKYSD